MNYTKEQEQAIFLRDKNIMVSAGAGAGERAQRPAEPGQRPVYGRIL